MYWNVQRKKKKIYGQMNFNVFGLFIMFVVFCERYPEYFFYVVTSQQPEEKSIFPKIAFFLIFKVLLNDIVLTKIKKPWILLRALFLCYLVALDAYRSYFMGFFVVFSWNHFSQ